MNFKQGSFEVGPLMITLSAEAIATMKPYSGPTTPSTRSTSASLSKPAPAPAPVRISPAPDTAPSAPAASLAADQPDVCSLSYQQQNLWRKPSGEPWQGTESASKPARPGLSLAALERLRS